MQNVWRPSPALDWTHLINARPPPPIFVDRLDMACAEWVQYLQTRERNSLLLAHLLSFVRRICRTGLGVRHIIDPDLTARTLKPVLGR